MPPDDVEGVKGKLLGTIAVGDNANDPRLQASTRTNAISMRRMDSGHKIAYIDLRLSPRQVTGAANEGDAIKFDSTYAPTPNYVPVHFLPWDSSGGSIRLTIPQAAPGQGPANPLNPANPFLFFTAAINGCSIFFRGTPQHPTIFHCGGGTDVVGLDAQAEFWEAVMDEFVDFDDNRNKAGKLGHLQASRVDKRDYVATPGVMSRDTSPTGVVTPGKSTAIAKRYQKLLNAKHALGKLNIHTVAPWGCVLGRRDDAGTWTFYLQENATVTYVQVALNPIKRIKGVTTSRYSVARPLIYREIFPNGPGHVTIRAGLPTIH